MKQLTGGELGGLKPKLKGIPQMLAGTGENSHAALDVQHKDIPRSKADQKTTKNKSEVDKNKE